MIWLLLICRRVHCISSSWSGRQTNEGKREAEVLYFLSVCSCVAVQGSVVFWYNLRPDGSREESALHGACPTILGTKWVTNKWIREGAQIWARPCQWFIRASTLLSRAQGWVKYSSVTSDLGPMWSRHKCNQSYHRFTISWNVELIFREIHWNITVFDYKFQLISKCSAVLTFDYWSH